MKPVKTHTSLERREKMFGLEIADFLVLAVLYAVVFLVSTNIFINLALVASAYLGLRLYKRGKPPQYSTILLRFLLTPKFYTLQGKESE